MLRVRQRSDQARLLDDRDRAAALAVCAVDPVANVFVESRIRAYGLDPGRLPALLGFLALQAERHVRERLEPGGLGLDFALTQNVFARAARDAGLQLGCRLRHRPVERRAACPGSRKSTA